MVPSGLGSEYGTDTEGNSISGSSLYDLKQTQDNAPPVFRSGDLLSGVVKKWI